MRTYKVAGIFGALGIASMAAAMTFLACGKVDSVKNQPNQPGTPVATCGSLDVAQATQIALNRLDHLGVVGLATLAGLENSRVAAQTLSFGHVNIIDPFVEDAQSDYHDALVQLRDEQLVATNVESTETSSVVFLLRPETLCRSDSSSSPPMPMGTGGTNGIGGASATSGTSSATLDSDCVSEQTAHPIRVRISRIACDQGDNVAIEITRDTPAQRLILAELYAERAEVELDLGAFLRASSSTTSSSELQSDGTYLWKTTRSPLVSSATGVIRGSLTLVGSAQANGSMSVSQAIDVAAADDSEFHFRLAAGTAVASVAADGAAKTIKVTSSLGALDLRTKFKYFISDFFGLSTSTSADTQQPVELHLAGLRGSINLDGAKDTIAAEGLDLGGSAASATQAGVTLLSVNATNATQGAIAVAITGSADNNLGMRLPDGLSVSIHYGLEPVMSLIENPADFLASDTLKFDSPSASAMTFLPESGLTDLAITYSQTGSLLRVDSGSLVISSSVWPNDTVTTSTGQCLTRTPTTLAGHHDLLNDFSVGTCTQ